MGKYTPVAINSRLETEALLGSLPVNWEKIDFKGRNLFIDHNTSTTTWVDPRTHHLRKHDVKEVMPGELPYGWEELYDKKAGVYYVDNMTGKEYREGPWTEATQQLVFSHYNEFARDPVILKEYTGLEKKKKSEVNKISAKISQLEAEKCNYEAELSELVDSMQIDPSKMDMRSFEAKQSQLKEQIHIYGRDIQKEKTLFEQTATEHSLLLSELQQFKKVLKKLKGNSDSLEEVDASADAEEMRQMIANQTRQRKDLEAEIQGIQAKLVSMLDAEQQKLYYQKEAAAGVSDAMNAPEAPLPAPGALNVDAELEALNARLQEEKEERQRLRDLKRALEAERLRLEEGDLQYIPDWVLDLIVDAKRSKTIRAKIREQAAANPDNLQFKDKVLKFTAAAIDANEKPKLPEDASKNKQKTAVKGKETAYASP